MLACCRGDCARPAEWQPVLHVPVVRAGERDLVSVVVPLVFCTQHRLSVRLKQKLRVSSRFQQALAHRLGNGWEPQTQKAWIERTRIVTDAPVTYRQ